ncbi:hypothetical protein SAMN05216489_06357 [Streptomyces sp. 3213]|uniref:hypothetical protein n=1 Tax=Streptomyces sp. 3213.3 TaxID=1855348 RepID=UPI0008975268|nr:hypothetical protein [Streptomyces sp. 3213.3]SEE36763.1 hypothetical protein SAMN05216489_06357 [Streptomyces sp. 3213] [Streptomyces sp. 3213.3]
MNTNLREPRRLPAAAIPDGCAAWDEERTRAWIRAGAPWWVPVRPRLWLVEQSAVLSLIVALCLLTLTDLPPYLIALLPLQAVWGVWRPEVVRFSVPVVAVVLALVSGMSGVSWPAPMCAALLLVASVTAAELRARARARQRSSAVAAADGVTAVLPAADAPVRRGRFLVGFGTVVAVPAFALLVASPLWRYAEDRRGGLAAGLFLLGLAFTVLLSGVLGRRRALALRRAPAPVLRVLVRKDGHGDAVVFAADDTTALRPLFTVPVMTQATDEDEEEEGDEEEELDELLDGLKDEERGPLHEAVLYGAPCDGAEVLLVSAAPKPGEPPLTEWSTGPVRPLSERGLRSRLAREERAAARAAHAEAEHAELVEAARTMTVVPVRRWRAGPVDRLSAFLVVQWGVWLCLIGIDDGFWHRALLLAIGLMGALVVPVKLGWRLTADRTGIWLNRLRAPRHISWDDLRSVRRESFELQLRVRGGDNWSVSAPRWPWLERKRGLTHPYDTLAAELSAMIADPALRPTGESGEEERGRPLWPYAVVLGIAWIAVLVTRWLS